MPTSEHIGWQSPRLRQAMMQTGTGADELYPKEAAKFLEDAKKRGQQMGWKGKDMLKDVAKKRYFTAEGQRRKVLLMVIDVRDGLIDKNVGISPLIDHTMLVKSSSIKDDEEVKATLKRDHERRARQLVSEQQRAAATLERMEEELTLQTAKQKEMARLDAIQAEKDRHEAKRRHRRQEKALEWQLVRRRHRPRHRFVAAASARACCMPARHFSAWS